MASPNTLRLRMETEPKAAIERPDMALRAALRRESRDLARAEAALAKLRAQRKRRAARLTRRGAKYRKLVG